MHGTQSRLILFLATCLSLGDIIAGLSRLVSFLKSDRRSVKLFWRYVILNQEDNKATERGGPEYTNLMAEELEGSKLADMSDAIPSEPSDDNTDDWANEAHRRHRRGFSTASDRTLACSNSTDTLNDSSGEPRTAKKWLGRAGQVLTLILERALVIGGFAMFLTGVVVYTGESSNNSRPKVYAFKFIAWEFQGGVVRTGSTAASHISSRGVSSGATACSLLPASLAHTQISVGHGIERLRVGDPLSVPNGLSRR